MSDPLRLGIAGLGTVGVGVVRIIRQQAALLMVSHVCPAELPQDHHFRRLCPHQGTGPGCQPGQLRLGGRPRRTGPPR